MSGVNKVVMVVAFLSLFHAAFSAAQHRSYLRITSQEFTSLPLDIVVQGVASMWCVAWAVVAGAGAGGGAGGSRGGLREVRAAAEARALTWDSLHLAATPKPHSPFYHYNTRRRALAPGYQPPPPSPAPTTLTASSAAADLP